VLVQQRVVVSRLSLTLRSNSSPRSNHSSRNSPHRTPMCQGLGPGLSNPSVQTTFEPS
jgi:hypothetical protein